MKKVLTIVALLSFGVAMAQEPAVTYMTKRNGQVVIMKASGGYSPLGETVKFKDGYTLYQDGHMTTPDGKTVNLQDGDRVYVDGNKQVKELDALKAGKTTGEAKTK